MKRRTTAAIGGLVVGAMVMGGTVLATAAAGLPGQGAGMGGTRSSAAMSGYRPAG